MLTLTVGNTSTTVNGDLDPVVYKAIRNSLGYRPENAQFMRRTLQFDWDGVVSTVCYKGKCKCPVRKPGIHFPSGLLGKVWEVFDQYKVEYQLADQRTIQPITDRYRFATIKPLRPYQQDVLDVAVKRGRGILKLCTGGGKTVIAAALIAALGVTPFIFYVPTRDLLEQAYNELSSMILTRDGHPVRIGRVGAGYRDIQDITVMTVQTAVRALDQGKYLIAKEEADRISERKRLNAEKRARKVERLRLRTEKETAKAQVRAKRLLQGLKPLKKYEPKIYKDMVLPDEAEEPEKLKDDDDLIDGTEEFEDIGEYREAVKQLITTCKGMICDETHHWASDTCQLIADWSFQCRYRYGFSATPWRDMNDDILIDACFGKQIADINASQLIDAKFLVAPTVYFVPINNMSNVRFADYVEAYELGIVRNELRNERIAKIAQTLVVAGRQILILVKHIAHGDLLESMIPGAVFLHGSKTATQRREHLDLMRLRRAPITIASTIFDEGIDVRPLDGLILAGGGKSMTRALQRVGRVIRPYEFEGYVKRDAIVVDFKDDMRWMIDHFKARRKIYRTEPRFVLKEMVIG